MNLARLVADVVNSATFDERILNLIPAVNYTFRIAAENSLGVGPYGEALRVPTCDMRAPAPQPPRIIARNITSIEIAWDTPWWENGQPVTQYRGLPA